MPPRKSRRRPRQVGGMMPFMMAPPNFVIGRPKPMPVGPVILRKQYGGSNPPGGIAHLDPFEGGQVDMKYFHDVPKPSEVPYIAPREHHPRKKKLGGIVSKGLRAVGLRSWADKAEQAGWGRNKGTVIVGGAGMINK